MPLPIRSTTMPPIAPNLERLDLNWALLLALYGLHKVYMKIERVEGMEDFLKDSFSEYHFNDEEKNSVLQWLLEYKAANQLSMNELLQFVLMNKCWIICQVFPSDTDD